MNNKRILIVESSGGIALETVRMFHDEKFIDFALEILYIEI